MGSSRSTATAARRRFAGCFGPPARRSRKAGRSSSSPKARGSRPASGRRWSPASPASTGRSNLPVVPVALDSGRIWPRRSFVKRPGIVTMRFGEPIPPGLPRKEVEAQGPRGDQRPGDLPSLEGRGPGVGRRAKRAFPLSCEFRPPSADPPPAPPFREAESRQPLHLAAVRMAMREKPFLPARPGLQPEARSARPRLMLVAKPGQTAPRRSPPPRPPPSPPRSGPSCRPENIGRRSSGGRPGSLPPPAARPSLASSQSAASPARPPADPRRRCASAASSWASRRAWSGQT